MIDQENRLRLSSTIAKTNAKLMRTIERFCDRAERDINLRIFRAELS